VVRERSFDVKISKPLQNSEKEKCVGCSSTKYYPTKCILQTCISGGQLGQVAQPRGDVLMVNLNDRKDSFIWTANKNFSVKNMYNDVVLRAGTPASCWVWKAKIPLKIEIFLWYLRNGVVLTKDNLVKRQWKGCTKCCFCAKHETIQHLFFDCPMATLMWGSVCFAFGIKKPRDVQHLFGTWLRSFSKKQRNLVLIGMAALCCALWTSRNDLVFQKSQ
jgi:hypothetical protein